MSLEHLSAEQVRARMAQVVAEHGEWTAYGIELRPGLFTRGPRADNGNDPRLRRITQVACDLFPRGFEGLRVLDLGCLEGQFSIEFALRGAEVRAFEARPAPVAKTRFAAECLGLSRLTVEQRDVRSLTREELGQFDLVLCLGLLYHLKPDDLFALAELLGQVCTRALFIDTYVAREPETTLTRGSATYQGSWKAEYKVEQSATEIQQPHWWGTVDRDGASFWFSQASLLRLLTTVGFTSAFEVLAPADPTYTAERRHYVALRGAPCETRATSVPNALPRDAFREPTIAESFPLLDKLVRVTTSMAKTVVRLEQRLDGQAGGPSTDA